MVIEHKLIDLDTMDSLALKYLGDATRWKEIADYNRLDYPYVVSSAEDLYQFYAFGFVTTVRANYQNDAVIAAGWKFQTKNNFISGNTVKTFEVTEDTLVPAGQQTAYVPVRCTAPGNFGNVLPGAISALEPYTAEICNMQFTSISNEQPIQGGRNVNVKVVGESIYIPDGTSEVVSPKSFISMLDTISGEDLILTSEGSLVLEPGGDLASVSGLENIKNAVSNRLMTELGELSLHPTYGTELESIVGSPNLANREKLIKIAVLRALSQEDRIKEPDINIVATEGTSVYLDIVYKLAIGNTPYRMTITL